jgi:hypothetical protein
MQPFAATTSWTIDVRHVLDFDFAEWTRAVEALARAHAEAAVDHLLRRTALVAEVFGNVGSARGEGFGWPVILRGLAMVEIDFDELGNPLLPKLVDSTSKLQVLEYPSMNHEQRVEFETLMKQKRGEFDARTRRR